jgi:hypothetical protein
MRTFLLASFFVFGACSSSPLDPGAGNSAGTGTSTLLVTGNASAHANIANAKVPADFMTDVSVHVSLNGQDVTTGTVTINSRSMKTPTALTYSQQNNGEWQVSIAGYDEVYELSVVSGPDKVTGVIVDGPDIHQFTAPMAGASLDSTMANTLTWERGIVADSATFRVGDLDRLAIQDTGTFSIPPGSLKAEKDQARPNTLQLTRTNQVVPKGAVAGSTFSVSIENELDVVALPNPAL